MKFPAHHHDLDTQGLYCPEPVMMLHQAVKSMQSGEVIKVVATDPSTQRDIPKFCTFLNYELVAQSTEDQLFNYWIAKP